MRRPSRSFLLLVALAALAWLSAGALHARQRYLTRGLSRDLPPALNHAQPVTGINLYLDGSDPAARDSALAQVAALGITHVKHSFHYRPAFDWRAADGLVEAIQAHGLTLVPLLDGDPARQFAPPDRLADFADWAGQFAARYGDHIDSYIIWDEPNLADHWGGRPVNPDRYAALLTAAGAAVRQADPGAVIVAAPLAPTVETGPRNLADPVFLQSLYEAGAVFDVVAAKPYGFDSGPDDRRVAADTLNFSRVILLREVMVRNGDTTTPIWAGNWGWNALPPDWAHAPSIWGTTDAETQAAWTTAALRRARLEWPWLGAMFLENWQPDAPPTDPRWGFSIADRPVAAALAGYLAQTQAETAAGPGFYRPNPATPSQTWTGDWEIVPGFGADSSEKTGDAPRDQVTLHFWGTDVGVAVRRADFRARYYATVDGGPANALPRDEYGSALVLDAPDPADDYIALQPVATGLTPGPHTLTLVAERGWDQFALQGFSVGYYPRDPWLHTAPPLLVGLGALAAALAARGWRRSGWAPVIVSAGQRFQQLSRRGQLAVLGGLAALAAATGWLTWGQQSAGLYRRLGDHEQLALTLAAASIFYVAPSFPVYVAALGVLFGLLAVRPAWGLALVALALPFHVPDLLKPVYVYRFAPAEVFVMVAVAAALVHRLGQQVAARRAGTWTPPTWRLRAVDWATLAWVAVATLSLAFTERLDVATNEWRTVIVEPALVVVLWRLVRPNPAELWTAVDAFVAGALIVALVGLVEYAFGLDPITAEGGLQRLRAVYGSPNNVALLFNRVVPLAAAVALLGRDVSRGRRLAYALACVPLLLAFGLTFSKGGLLLGLPAAAVVLATAWLTATGRRVWPWLAALAAAGAVVVVALWRIPALAARLDLLGETSFLRINLWRAGLNMFRDHFWTGVGLDNFLYAYRGRYIFAEAWREPNLSHPHNVLLDLGTRLGVLGVVVGVWLLGLFGRMAARVWRGDSAESGARALALGLLAVLAAVVAHGLVDHSFFLPELAFSFFFLFGLGDRLAARN